MLYEMILLGKSKSVAFDAFIISLKTKLVKWSQK